MSLRGLDLVPLSRSLSQVAERPDDRVDAFLERQEVTELPAGGDGVGIAVRREEGFAVRLVRGEHCWMATGDSLAPVDLLAALRQVARTWPAAAYPAPQLVPPEWPALEVDRDLARFGPALNRALRSRLVAFPLDITVRRHQRWIQVVGQQLNPDPESELFYSAELATPWGKRGLLTTNLSEARVGELADSLVMAFESRDADPAPTGELSLVLAPQATAIMLHEAVAHALEADVLSAGGSVEAAVGLRMGSRVLSVLDDPGAAPPPVRRRTDDEGVPVERRWLLREGVVEQPLADSFWARRSSALLPGAARRGGRLDPPSPRSTHLTLLPGEASLEELLEGEGLWVPQIVWGRLHVDSGLCRLRAPFGRRFENGELGEMTGPFTIEGRIAELLDAVVMIGDREIETGAGWCAKGRQRLAVWASAPGLRLDRARVVR